MSLVHPKPKLAKPEPGSFSAESKELNTLTGTLPSTSPYKLIWEEEYWKKLDATTIATSSPSVEFGAMLYVASSDLI